MLSIDGSMGEGGGQVLRSALALSLCFGRPFRIEGIRAGRDKPGLLRQHLAAVRAAAAVGGAEVEGAELGSRSLSFRPGTVRPGRFELAIGSAGSAVLVLQTVLMPLAMAGGDSVVVIEGGTHNPLAPPWPYFERVVLPALRGMGLHVEGRLVRAGFQPAGGGIVELRVGRAEPKPWFWMEQGPEIRWRAEAQLAGGLRADIARRELETCARLLGPVVLHERKVQPLADAGGPGNLLYVEAEMAGGREIFSALGSRGRAAEEVAAEACAEATSWRNIGAPVGPHLADQLLLPLALLAGGGFRTGEPTLHTRTQVDLLAVFGLRDVHLGPCADGTWEARVQPR